MKKLIYPIVLLLVSSQFVKAQTSRFTGTWQGAMNVGVEVRVVFHIKADPKAGFTSTADSPDQDAFGIKCDTTIINGSEIKIEMKALQASYTGTLVNDTLITGFFTQGGNLPLNLVKSDKVLKRIRPQTPVPPFPYKSEDILYYSKDSIFQYGATITIPEGKGPFPAMVLITGSGLQNRDEEIVGHKTFAVIADHLTRRGYIVLRVDDRGIGETTGSLNATSEDFAADVSTGVDYLLTRPEVNKNKIGLLGHSEGGMIAPIVATKRKDINFIILLAGPGVKIIDLMAEQNVAVARSNGISEPTLKEIGPLFKKVVSAVMDAPDSTEAIKQAGLMTEAWAARQPVTILKEIDFETAEKRANYAVEMVRGLQGAWYRYFIKFDPFVYLSKLETKVLALNGEKDIQVVSSQNLPGIESALKKSRSRRYMVKELAGLNHLFQSCKKCTVGEYIELEETISALALDAITNWLEKEVK